MSMLDVKINRTIEVADRFSTLLEEETTALTKADYDHFSRLQDGKFQLAQAYQDAILAFEDDLPQMSALEAKIKDKLRQVHSRYSTAVSDNEKALLAAKNVTERMVKLVMQAARQSVMDGPAYGANGIQGISEKIPVHFKLNEQI